jgi:hypothetical protein
MVSPLTVLCYKKVTFRPSTYDRMLFEYSEGFESFDWCTGSQISSFSPESTLHHAGQMEQSKDPKVKVQILVIYDQRTTSYLQQQG